MDFPPDEQSFFSTSSAVGLASSLMNRRLKKKIKKITPHVYRRFEFSAC